MSRLKIHCSNPTKKSKSPSYPKAQLTNTGIPSKPAPNKPAKTSALKWSGKAHSKNPIVQARSHPSAIHHLRRHRRHRHRTTRRKRAPASRPVRPSKRQARRPRRFPTRRQARHRLRFTRRHRQLQSRRTRRKRTPQIHGRRQKSRTHALPRRQRKHAPTRRRLPQSHEQHPRHRHPRAKPIRRCDLRRSQITTLNLIDKIEEADGIYAPNEPSAIGVMLGLEQVRLAGKNTSSVPTPLPRYYAACAKVKLTRLSSKTPTKWAMKASKSSTISSRVKPFRKNRHRSRRCHQAKHRHATYPDILK